MLAEDTLSCRSTRHLYMPQVFKVLWRQNIPQPPLNFTPSVALQRALSVFASLSGVPMVRSDQTCRDTIQLQHLETQGVGICSVGICSQGRCDREEGEVVLVADTRP